MQVARTIVALAGFPGSPGVNVVHWARTDEAAITTTDYDDFGAALRSLWAGLPGALVGDMTIQLPTETEVIDEVTGELVGTVAASTPWAVVTANGTKSTNFSQQALLRFGTGAIRNGRRVQGRMFWGPIPGGVIGDNGLLSPTPKATLQGLLDDVFELEDQRIGVYSRPVVRPGGGDFGQFYPAISATVADKIGDLRGRRP